MHKNLIIIGVLISLSNNIVAQNKKSHTSYLLDSLLTTIDNFNSVYKELNKVEQDILIEYNYDSSKYILPYSLKKELSKKNINIIEKLGFHISIYDNSIHIEEGTILIDTFLFFNCKNVTINDKKVKVVNKFIIDSSKNNLVINQISFNGKGALVIAISNVNSYNALILRTKGVRFSNKPNFEILDFTYKIGLEN